MSKTAVDLNGKHILVTGSPGFIGGNLVLRLMSEMRSGTIVSLDNMNDYYDPKLKEYRLGLIEKAAESSPIKHIFVKGTIADKGLIDKLFAEYKFDVVVNLAAQAGISFSGVISARLPSGSSAQRSIPSERTPAKVAGLRFTRTITFFPTISSAE